MLAARIWLPVVKVLPPARLAFSASAAVARLVSAVSRAFRTRGLGQDLAVEDRLCSGCTRHFIADRSGQGREVAGQVGDLRLGDVAGDGPDDRVVEGVRTRQVLSAPSRLEFDEVMSDKKAICSVSLAPA